MTRSASPPLPACPTTSTPPTCCSRKHNSSRASCSSSTTMARSVSALAISSGNPRRDRQIGKHDPGARALTRNAVELELVIGAVDHAEALVDVPQPDAAAFDAVHVDGADADAIVDH